MGSGPARKEVLKIKGVSVKKAANPRFLNAAAALPYHLRAGRYQCFGNPNRKAARKPGPMAGGLP
jgi:hypothetical protein